ncbi:MAG: type II toxin-antitoxin system RelE/ParE family toxin [Candidatus Competibacteraceae bacterium]
MKPIVFLGDSLDVIRSFPESARQQAGYQLDKVQRGREPDDWKPMKSIGPGVNEIRIREESGAFRVIYVAKLDDAIYVLHAFQKKSQRTSRTDLNLAKMRLQTLRNKR